LRSLFLNNDLAEGRFLVGGKPITLTDIRTPVFAVGTERDHVAPWRSTYKVTLQFEAEVTYLLTTGGHNAGIVSEPGRAGRGFRIRTKGPSDHYLDPERFYAEASRKDGSWWPEWVAWLADRSGAMTAVPAMGAPQAGYPPLGDAPGAYVFEQ
jgi:polyhydroxyalkanoate synthase